MKTNILAKTREKSEYSSKYDSQESPTYIQNNLQQSSDLFKEFIQETTSKAHKQKQTEEKETSNNLKMLSGNHSSYQLMQHLLTGANCQETCCMLSTHQEEQELGQMLTNRYKIENYKLQLKRQIKQGNQKQTKHLKFLLVLLQQVGKCQIEVKYNQQGLSIGFNNKRVSRLQEQIDRLQQQNEKRKKQMQEMSKQYDKIVYQFNEVIEKLVQKQQKYKPLY